MGAYRPAGTSGSPNEAGGHIAILLLMALSLLLYTKESFQEYPGVDRVADRHGSSQPNFFTRLVGRLRGGASRVSRRGVTPSLDEREKGRRSGSVDR